MVLMLFAIAPASFSQKKKTPPPPVAVDPSLDPVNIQKAMDEAFEKFKLFL